MGYSKEFEEHGAQACYEDYSDLTVVFQLHENQCYEHRREDKIEAEKADIRDQGTRQHAENGADDPGTLRNKITGKEACFAGLGL